MIEKGNNQFYCYDLTEATDRLPVSLQKSVLELFLDSSVKSPFQGIGPEISTL